MNWHFRSGKFLQICKINPLPLFTPLIDVKFSHYIDWLTQEGRPNFSLHRSNLIYILTGKDFSLIEKKETEVYYWFAVSRKISS